MKFPMIIRKVEDVVNTSQGNIPYRYFEKVSLVCKDRKELQVGDNVCIFAGKKIPKGTKATIKAIGINKFEVQKNKNPCLLLQLESGEDVWTTGKNCYKLGELGVEKKLREVTDLEFCSLNLEAEGFVSDKTMWYFEGEPGKSQLVEKCKRDTIYEFSVASDPTGKMLFKETENEYAMILKDRRTDDACPFLVIKKEFKPGNCVMYKNFALSKSADQYTRACKTFEEYNG